MKKLTRKLTAVVTAAMLAAGSLSVGASAASGCNGRVCYITLPSGCGTDLAKILAEYFPSLCFNGSCAKPAETTTTPAKPVETTTPVKPAETTTPAVTTVSSEISSVLSLVNSERAKNGLGALKLDDRLCALADIRAKEITASFSHTRPDGTSCFTVFKQNGVTYRYAGENLAYGQTSAAAVMNGWMNSSGHRANILGKNFGKIGISCLVYGGRKYWVQLFTD